MSIIMRGYVINSETHGFKDVVRMGKMKVYEIKQGRIVKALLRHAKIHLGEAEIIAASKELDGFGAIDDEEAVLAL